MATVYARDLIEESLRIVGAIAIGEAPSAAEAQAALRTLNTMLDLWDSQSLMIYHNKRELFPYTAGVATYTFGPSGDWTIPTSDEIVAMSAIYGSTVELPVSLLSLGEWQQQVVKSTTSAVPLSAYVETDYPDKTVTLWPVPTGSGQVVVYHPVQLSSIDSLDTVISLPQGYREAIVQSLAIRLAVQYGRQVDPVTAELASVAIASIKRANIKPTFAKTDRQLRAMSGRGWGSFRNRENG